MGDVLGIGQAIGGVAQGYGSKKAAESSAGASKYGADVSNQVAARQLKADQASTAYQSAQSQQLSDAYRQAYQNQASNYSTGESNLANLYSKSPEELETLKNQALTGQAEELQQGTGQLNAALAQQGVRGGQAATQMRRGIGEMTKNASENIQNIIANEAINRAKEQRQYSAGEQQNIQNFLLNPQSAQYSQATTADQQQNLKDLMSKYLAVK
jgi:hypothetical protein